MTLQTLSSTFPADPEQASLAYAQSGSVVEFIIDTYGQEALAGLLEIFSEGALYDEALEEALGVDTWGLDKAWRESIGAAPLEIPAPAQATAMATAQSAAAATEAAPASTTAPTAPQESPPVDNPSSALPCLGSSVIGAAVVTLFLLLRPRGTEVV